CNTSSGNQSDFRECQISLFHKLCNCNPIAIVGVGSQHEMVIMMPSDRMAPSSSDSPGCGLPILWNRRPLTETSTQPCYLRPSSVVSRLLAGETTMHEAE